jgi:hypothetical protein
MSKRKSAPRSLFKLRTVSIPPSRDAPDRKVFGILISDLFGSAQSDFQSPAEVMESSFAIISAAGLSASKSESIQRGTEYWVEIETRIQQVRNAIKSGDTIEAVNAAMLLTQVWMQLRADAAFARDVRDAERRHRNLRHSPAVTDQQIVQAVQTYSTKKEAAERLGISTRQLRKRQERLP